MTSISSARCLGVFLVVSEKAQCMCLRVRLEMPTTAVVNSHTLTLWPSRNQELPRTDGLSAPRRIVSGAGEKTIGRMGPVRPPPNSLPAYAPRDMRLQDD